ncbi:MAG: hypothetical protein WB721_02690 [Pseudolabrys sp.]|jgi:hypothetical protein
MNIRSTVISASLVLSIGMAAAGSAIAQGMMDDPHHGMMGRGMMQGDTEQGMMGRGAMQGGTGRGMTSGGMMGTGMMQGGEGGMNCPMMGGMMQGGQSMMGSGMMGPETMRGSTRGMSSLFGSRVVPTMNLSVDDVRGYLTARLDRLGNKRLKIGNINADGGSITAEIVTVDNSLVQRMKVDRSTGNIEYEN